MFVKTNTLQNSVHLPIAPQYLIFRHFFFFFRSWSLETPLFQYHLPTFSTHITSFSHLLPISTINSPPSFSIQIFAPTCHIVFTLPIGLHSSIKHHLQLTPQSSKIPKNPQQSPKIPNNPPNLSLSKTNDTIHFVVELL